MSMCMVQFARSTGCVVLKHQDLVLSDIAAALALIRQCAVACCVGVGMGVGVGVGVGARGLQSAVQGGGQPYHGAIWINPHQQRKE